MTPDEFILDWKSGNDSVELLTSGSTGEPKRIYASKSGMKASAALTCAFLGLEAGDTALLCLPVDYIAGKMMVVRALTCGLKLISVKPSGHPLEDIDCEIDFAAMTPMQVYNSMQEPGQMKKLLKIRNLIIGGAPIPLRMEKELRNFPNAVWSTYGMTETLSHIALRRLSGEQASQWYSPFDGVEISLSDRGTLVIYAPMIVPERLVTNDLAIIAEDGVSFRIIGRANNVINSGGVKLHIEEIEAKLQSCLPMPFAITSRKHPKFGEVVMLLVETAFGNEPEDGGDVPANIERRLFEVYSICRAVLSPYAVPKIIAAVGKIPTTATGKVDRKEVLRIAGSKAYFCSIEP